MQGRPHFPPSLHLRDWQARGRLLPAGNAKLVVQRSPAHSSRFLLNCRARSKQYRVKAEAAIALHHKLAFAVISVHSS